MINSSFSQSQIIDLWDGSIPNSQKTTEVEIVEIKDIKRISNVQTPTLEVFLPTKRANSARAVIICPGGGYHMLAYDWEGTEIAKWFNTKGIAAFVLKSRLPDSKSIVIRQEAPLQDAQRAVRYLRSHAVEFGISPDEIGVIGFSAGGHLASTLGTQYDKPNNFKETALDTISARPNFMALIYPVITMDETFTHMGSRRNLIGEKPSEVLIKEYSNELQVTKNTPRTFLVHSGDDKAVPIKNSLKFYEALKAHDVEAELHVYPFGGHGFGLAIGNGRLQSWPERLFEWLENK
ncbi:alpha/beta hydrolase [Algibacter sp. L1A34]|uniref:alpha/beta hydrolase n=1 Tax=Algibacter sp. L1A34 TaxID=2686365 RepID=UPI001E4169FD|nr:alpha/beta hydrolase [Algibacter sp. L1A34]